MPCYEYICTNKDCGIEVEYIRKFSQDKVFEKCPMCSSRMKKTVPGSTFVLGSGSWFKNGYDKGG